MLEINAQHFMDAVREMKRIQVLIEAVLQDTEKDEPMGQSGRDNAAQEVVTMISALESLYANVSLVAARRLLASLENDEAFTWRQLQNANADIESRLRDELGFVNMLVFGGDEQRYFLSGSALLGELVADRLPSVIFEMEEAAKCLAMGRATASAFHSMRTLEIAIKSIAKFLDIPDPVKPAQRNWGSILKTIKESIDEKFPSRERMPGSDGAKVEEIYTSLDAIKNPWRNSTMHTENTYQPHEASHILQCVNYLLLKLAELCDEHGNRVDRG